MPHFTQALTIVIDRTFGGKRAALSAASGLHSTEIGRILTGESPLSDVKLQKLSNADGLSQSDHDLLLHAAVRDYVGEEAYLAHFAPHPAAESTGLRVADSLDGTIFRSLFPLHPRAQQVIAYLINKAGTDKDVVTALELLGRFLELPEP